MLWFPAAGRRLREQWQVRGRHWRRRRRVVIAPRSARVSLAMREFVAPPRRLALALAQPTEPESAFVLSLIFLSSAAGLLSRVWNSLESLAQPPARPVSLAPRARVRSAPAVACPLARGR